MAGIKISELPATSLIYADDSLILSRGDSTRKIAGRHFATTVITDQLSANNTNLSRSTANTFKSLSSNTFTAISGLSLETFTVIASLSSTISAKKRWIDFIS